MDRNASLLGLFEAMLGLVKNAIENAENQTNGALRKVKERLQFRSEDTIGGREYSNDLCISQSYGVHDM